MSIRLSKIDDLTRPDHTFLDPADECFYLGEYNARKGYQFSATNNLIFNLKKPMDRRGKPGWSYKASAIEEAARQLRAALDAMNPKWLSRATLIPIPPSQAKGDPLYDDRLRQLLRVLGAGLQLDVRELILQLSGTAAAHTTASRPSVSDLIANYVMDENACEPAPRVIGVVDDVLTTGSHFKAMQHLLRDRFPQVKIYGIFLARRVPESVDV